MASRLRPDSAEWQFATRQAAAGDPVAVTATTVFEISHGLHKAARGGVRPAVAHLRWLRGQLDAGVIIALAFDARAAEVAGYLRAAHPAAPAGEPQPKRRIEPERRVAWVLDVQIAATTWVHGHSIVTTDAHFPLLSTALHNAAPSAPPLAVIDPAAVLG